MAPYAFESLLQYSTLMSYNDRSAQRCFRLNTPNMYAYLHRFDRSLMRTPRFVDNVQCLHVIGQTTCRSLPSASMKTEKQSQNLDSLGNIEILARTCPIKMSRMVNLL